MPTLVLTLKGPMQAWGTSSKFSERQTEVAPSKSGVLGLVAAAQGLRRTEPLTELVGLRFGVRADQPGRMLRDFQTAREENGRGASVSNRYYLSDALFLAALESKDTELLKRIQKYLRRPVFPLYLGRRAFPPSGPIPNEMFDGSIEQAFETLLWRAGVAEKDRQREHFHVSIETRIDAAPGARGSFRQRDIPVTFDPERPEHRWREVDFGRVLLENPAARGIPESPQGKPSPSFRRSQSETAAIEPPLFGGEHDPIAAIPEGD